MTQTVEHDLWLALLKHRVASLAQYHDAMSQHPVTREKVKALHKGRSEAYAHVLELLEMEHMGEGEGKDVGKGGGLK